MSHDREMTFCIKRCFTVNWVCFHFHCSHMQSFWGNPIYAHCFGLWALTPRGRKQRYQQVDVARIDFGLFDND